MSATRIAHRIYAGTLFQGTGPAFDALPFPALGSPGGATGAPVGSGTLTFADLDNGTFAYTINGITQTKAITRETFGLLDMESRRELCLRARLTTGWSGSPLMLEEFPLRA